MPACIHRHVNTNTSTSPVFVLEFMGHLIYIDTRAWVWIRDVQNGDGLCFQRDAKRRILFAEEDSLSIEANVVLSFRPPPPREGDWKGEGREGVKKKQKTAIFLSFPTQSPLLLPGVASLSLNRNPGGNTRPRGSQRNAYIEF